MKDVKLGGGLYLTSNELGVKIKRLSSDAVIPQYQSEQASGFDFHSAESITIMPGETKLIGTGLSFELPTSFELQIRPRSGLSAKTNLRAIFGTVDSDFRGEVKIILQNTGVTPFFVELGDRVAQGIVSPVYRAIFEEVLTLEKTERGNNGFGSSGK